MDPVSIIVSFLLSLVVPIIVIAIRQTVKMHRREIIEDLAAVFHSGAEPAAQRLVPSFEFVKFKYFADGSVRAERHDFQFWAWAVAVVPFFLVVSSISYICIEFLQHGSSETLFGDHKSLDFCLIAVFAAFCGGYLNAIRTLTRSIQNFDLSPSLIVTLATEIFSGVVLAAVTAYVLYSFGPEKPVLAAGVLAVLAFAIGYYPDAAQRALANQSKLRNFKRENLSVYKYSLATPVELIDGIDSGIRNRLSDFHIATTQNLATANPLMLFVETPFGVYQIMDWVAQAQLCASVGPEAMTAMWKLGVRTLFDLERAALDERCRNRELLECIGRHLLDHKDGQAHFSQEAIIANIQMRLDDPHVHRLRQIYMQVGMRIGERHWRLRDDAIGPKSYDATGIVFQNPNNIRLADSRIDIRPNDYVAVVGGKNNGKFLKVLGVDRTLVTVNDNLIDDNVAESGCSIKLFRLSH